MNRTHAHLRATLKCNGLIACAIFLLCSTSRAAHAQGPPPQPPRIATIMLDSPPRTPGEQKLKRVLQGRVLDSTGKGIAGAIVSLKNSRTSSTLSVITGNDGSYRFVQLPKETDYQLWAEIDKRRSEAKSISSFDTSNEMRRDIGIK